MFLVGGLLGFFMNNDTPDTSNVSEGVHQMADGTMMADEEMMNNGMSMEQMMADMNTALVGKVGRDFDMAFVEQMIIHHQGAVEMAQLALQYAESEEVKKLAEEIISAQTKEIELMNSWRAAW